MAISTGQVSSEGESGAKQDGSVGKVLAAEPEDLSLTPRTYKVELEDQLLQVVF